MGMKRGENLLSHELVWVQVNFFPLPFLPFMYFPSNNRNEIVFHYIATSNKMIF
jgi:hypothetical protein